MGRTRIEWCDCTLNPVVGCTKISPGCENCYAERFAARLAKNPKTAARYEGVVDEAGHWTGKVNINLDIQFPQRPQNIFMASMGDIFHEAMTYDDLRQLFYYMTINTHLRVHRYLLLTKRAARMRLFTHNYFYDSPNIWLGVTVCNQSEADEKIPLLLQSPAAGRFVSVEPMLEAIDLEKYLRPAPAPRFANIGPDEVLPTYTTGSTNLDWVICGPETGSGARPCRPDWIASLKYQCVEAGVPFFDKSKTPLGRAWPWETGK